MIRLSMRKKDGPLPPPVSQNMRMSPTRKDGMNLGLLPSIQCEFDCSPCGVALRGTAESCWGLGKSRFQRSSPCSLRAPGAGTEPQCLGKRIAKEAPTQPHDGSPAPGAVSARSQGCQLGSCHPHWTGVTNLPGGRGLSSCGKALECPGGLAGPQGQTLSWADALGGAGQSREEAGSERSSSGC